MKAVDDLVQKYMGRGVSYETAIMLADLELKQRNLNVLRQIEQSLRRL